MYYWDGQAWRSTMSPDGRFRWDGTAWTPVSSMLATPYGLPRATREPTSWTRPLQYAVIAWYVWSILFSLSEPFWAGGMMSNIFNQSFQRQQQLNPEVSPPPAELVNAMTSLMTVSMWVTVVIYAAVFAVIIAGAWNRWVWMYYVVLVLLGLTSVLLPVQIIDAFIAPSLGSAMGLNMTMPSWLYPVALGTGVLAVGLFVWMLVGLIKRGPWAMRRPAAG
jgi:hypothetical protein